MKKDAKYYCEEGVKRYKKGSKSALKSFQKALELALNDPSTPKELLNDIYTDLFCYYDKLSPDYSKALIYFDKIIDTNVDDEEIAKAKEFRAEIKANPDKFDEQTLLKRANQIRIMNEVDANGILLYIKCLILFDNPKCDEIFYIVAQNNKSNSTLAAERNIKQAIAINPNRQEYYDLYFSIMLRILADEYGEKTFSKTVKKYDKTIKDTINKSIKIKPTAQAYLNYYYYYNLLRDFKSALKALDKAIELDPNCAQKYMDKGQILEDQKKYEEAISCYKKAEEISLKEDGYIPEYLYTTLGYWYYCLKEYVEALKYYNKAIKKNLDSWYPYRDKIGILISLGKYKFALKWVEKAEKTFKNELDRSFYGNKGIALFCLGDYKNAIKNLKKDPEYENGKVLISYCKYLLGDNKRALKEIENIYSHEKLDLALCCLSVIYTSKKEYEKALETCNKIQEQDADIDIIRAYIYKKMGDVLNSDKYLNLAVETDEKKRTKEWLIKDFEYSSQVNFD
jgi:tetratricopeptide TPR_2